MSFLFGSAPKSRKVDFLNEGQTDLLNDLIRRVMSGSGGFGFDEDFFQQSYVDPAMREFEGRIAPSIQQKFIGAGTGRGSNVQDALTRAGADVEGSLAKQRAELLNQALNRQLQGTQLALGTKQFGLEQTPGEDGFLSFAAPLLGGLAGGALGGPAGFGIGVGTGQAISKGFRR